MTTTTALQPGQRVELLDGRSGTIITQPARGATDAMCFGVRFSDGSAKIVKEHELKRD